MIAHGCVAEFAAVIGTTTNGGRSYLADALELAHRLPRLYARIQAGTLATWKGRRIARETIVLPPDAVTDLDAQITPIANKLSARATQQLVDETIATAIPEHAQYLADANKSQHVRVDHRQVSFLGTSNVYAALDLADALDLDARRAMALGRLARGETSNTGHPVTLYIHLPADTDATTALVENGDGPHLLTQTQVATWCGNPDVKVTIKPVIDLHEPLSSSSYEVPDRIKEHVELRDRTCAFPHCDRLARTCQQDHIKPHSTGGTTATSNLASC